MRKAAIIISMLAVIMFLFGCGKLSSSPDAPESDSGVSKATAKVDVGTDGLTVEQRNIQKRLKEDSNPGAIKHLYFISTFSGDVILYSTVKGKVTSSGKRLTPYQVCATDGEWVGGSHQGFPITIGGRTYRTGEVLQDDGTYGHSIPYIYWWDAQDRYHQEFLVGGFMVHLTDQPLVVNKVIINVENSNR